MKVKNIFHIAIFSLLLILSGGCDDDILEEVPEGFLSPENALQNVEGFEAVIFELHRRARGLRTSEGIMWPEIEGDKAVTTLYANGTDLAWFVVPAQNFFTDYSRINSTNIIVRNYWRMLYKMVNNANSIITRVQEAPIEEDDRLLIEAKAKFFRAFAYRYLVHLWGGVPIITEEITNPKFDFVRATSQEVLQLMQADLEFASQYLPVQNPGDGRLSKAAADHVLAETLISLGDYDGAIAATTSVIGDGQYELMRQRFGEHTNMPGDPFWDLFRLNNQNRTSGNRESIWIWQMEFGVLGGEGNHRFTRAWRPFTERLRDSEGNRTIIDTDDIGRGVGFVKPTYYLDSLIWLSDFDGDIRNSPNNMQRRFVNNNPESIEFGQVIQPKPSDLDRNHFVYVTKAASPEGYPQGFDRTGRMFTEIYAIRLAETYLLRAEAYLAKGDNANAAADINEVRNRANATPVAAADVDLDYLLDERARELVAEEPRRLTLARTNKLVERVKLHNPISGPSIQDFHRYWPIPQEEIDANLEAELEQNDGY